MKKWSLVFLLCGLASYGQSKKNPCDVLSKIQRLIVAEHYKPKPVDDSLSVYVFEKWLAELDPNKNIFLKSEYDELSKHRLSIDNYAFQKNCRFIEDVANVYEKALTRSKKAIEKIRQLPMNYKSGDTVRFSKKGFSFYVKNIDVEKVYTKRLKFDILEDISKSSKNLDSIKQNFAAIEKISNQKIVDAALCKIENRLNPEGGIENAISQSLFNIFCSYFDPHTSYFSYDTKSSFLSELSTNSLSLGLIVTLNENEELIVDDVVPGGPASGEQLIEKGDQVIKISPKEGMEFLVSCTSLQTIGSVIFSDTYKKITVSFRKKNGQEYAVTLEKKMMKAEDHSVYSMTLTKNGVKSGYINIPSFYTDFETNDQGGVADDVLKEIIKLKKENVQGLILDLQNDGGGSMDEAVKLAGLFIDSGPVSVSVNNRQNQRWIRDFNRGTAYNGPLIILVNGNSASASEFFAAAMQDYNRALIIGSATHGKASMQQIFPIDNGNQDFVKLTIEKFYRVNGTSHQQTGVIPDVAIPQLYDNIINRENSEKTALKNDVVRVSAKFRPYQRTFENLQQQSIQRVADDEFLNKIKSLNEKIEVIYKGERPTLTISLENIFEDIHRTDNLFDEIKELSKTKMDFVVETTEHQSIINEKDSFQKNASDARKKELLTNYTANEALNIIAEFQQSLKN